MSKALTLHTSIAALITILSLVFVSCLASDETETDVSVANAATSDMSAEPNNSALDIPLLSETGLPISINSLDTPIRLVFFGFTYCPDICPLTLHKVASALRLLDRPAEDIAVLFISVDPKRDTPEILAQYTNAFHDQIIGLSGDTAQLQKITEHFRTTFGYNIPTDAGDQPLPIEQYNSLAADTNYMPYHSSQIYILDKSGEIVDLIGLGSDIKLIAQIIESAIGV